MNRNQNYRRLLIVSVGINFLVLVLLSIAMLALRDTHRLVEQTATVHDTHHLVGRTVTVHYGFATGPNSYSRYSPTGKVVSIDDSWITLSFGRSSSVTIPANNIYNITPE